MDLHRHVGDLQHQLATAAAAGGDESRELAARLTAPLDAAARLVLLEALAEAAAEISTDLAPGSVDLRLRGGSTEFVVTPAVGTTPPSRVSDPGPGPGSRPQEAEGAATSRTTLRLPDHLKARTEIAAAREGVSVNTWLVRAVTTALEQESVSSPPGRTGRRVTGWVY